MAERRTRLDGRMTIVLALVAGVAAVVVAMVAGVVPDLFALVARPAPIVRAGLAGAAFVVGGRLLLAALRRIDSSMNGVMSSAADGAMSDVDLGTMVRGVRLVFLAAASFTAALGWLLAEPLPLVVALVIAGVDVVETSFMLLVASRRGT